MNDRNLFLALVLVLTTCIGFCLGVMNYVDTHTMKVMTTVYAHTVDVTAFAYSSTTRECDSNPWRNASGKRPRFGSIACNWLPFGTVITIKGCPKQFVVDDRMSKRWDGKKVIDIWMKEPLVAKWFGKRKLQITYYYKDVKHEDIQN